MLDYNELYEFIRKEKYSEQLQVLPKDFVKQFSLYLKNKKEKISQDFDMLSEEAIKDKKNFENSISIFKELMLRRKKKILGLVFMASETGIMKRDYSNLLDFEQNIFDNLVKVMNEGDMKLNELLNGGTKKENEKNKMIIMKEKIEEFVDLNGDNIGPFEKGQLANLDKEVAEILVSGGKATFVDN